jgi:LacI family transcriptional regulator
MEAAHARGLRVPEDVAVVGFDDVEAAALSTPPLSTVRVYKEQLGEVALGLLAERVGAEAGGGTAAGFERAPSTTRIATELVVRSSG